MSSVVIFHDLKNVLGSALVFRMSCQYTARNAAAIERGIHVSFVTRIAHSRTSNIHEKRLKNVLLSVYISRRSSCTHLIVF